MYEQPAVTSDENRPRYESARERWERRRRGLPAGGPDRPGRPTDPAEARRILELAALLGIG